MRILNRKIPTNAVIASLLLAFFADTQILNLIFLAANPSFSGFMAIMYGVIVVLLLFVGIFWQRRSLFSLTPAHIGIFILCNMWYMFTNRYVGQPSVSLPYFCIFTLAAFIIPGIIRIDVRTFLLALFLFPSVGIFYIRQIILDSIMEEGILSMGKCYSMLIPVLANLVYMRFFFKKEKKWIRIILLPFTAINIFYLIQMTMFGSRGPILCVLLLIASFFVIRVTNDNNFYVQKKRILVIAIGAIILGVSFVPLLQTFNIILAEYDIQIVFVDKFLRLEDSGDMTNGRMSISNMAIEGFLNSPLVGNGLAQFERNTGEVYPHNFILQLLYDGGLILSCSVLGSILMAAYKKFKHIGTEEFICLLLLFFGSVPGAMFSGDLWNALILWMFFGFLFSKKICITNYKILK